MTINPPRLWLALVKKKYSFFSQKNFAWLLDDQEEKNFIKLMKRATNLIIKANYSLNQLRHQEPTIKSTDSDGGVPMDCILEGNSGNHMVDDW